MKKLWLALVGVLVIGATIYIATKDPVLAYIPNAEDGTISVIDTEKDEIVNTIKVDSQLSDGIEVSRDGKQVYAGNYDKGELFIRY